MKFLKPIETELVPATDYQVPNRQFVTSGYQPLDADLTSIAGLIGTSGLLRKTSANTWSLDTTALGDMTKAVYDTNNSGAVDKAEGVINQNGGALVNKTWTGTKAQYDAIVTKDANITYITTDEAGGSYVILDGTGRISSDYMPLVVSNHIASTDNPHMVTPTQIGLGNVDNTSDNDKPVSQYTLAALNGKSDIDHVHFGYAPLESPTFTGTVSGITKAMVGLSNVDNTSDANKPISTAAQTALDLKAPLASPSFTGTTSIYQIIEQANLVATAFTAGTNIDLKTGALFYNTANSTANPTFNFRGDGTTTLASMLAVGKSITLTILITNSGTAYYPTAYTIDGTSVTPKWSGTAPTSGNASAIDVYTYTIIKTAATPTYTVLASRTKFA